MIRINATQLMSYNSRDNALSLFLYFSSFCNNVGTTGKKIPNFSGTVCSIVQYYHQMYFVATHLHVR